MLLQGTDVQRFWGQSWAVGIRCSSGAAMSLELTTPSPWVREEKEWGNYFLLEKIDESKSTTWKQYAGSNRLSFHCHRGFFLQVPAIYGVDTRMLTKIIRDKVWSSSLAELVPLLTSPSAWRTHWRAQEETWPAPSSHFCVTVLHPSDVVFRTEALMTMQLGAPEIHLPGQDLLSAY